VGTNSSVHYEAKQSLPKEVDKNYKNSQSGAGLSAKFGCKTYKHTAIEGKAISVRGHVGL
jgi:hypothetical protein